MSLRTRFIALFTILAVIPLVGVGVVSYVRSLRAVEALVETQVEEIARSAARQVQERYTFHQSNLLLLAQNAETQGLFAAHASGDADRIGEAMATAGPYLDQAGRILGPAYPWIELRNLEGEVLYRLGAGPEGDDAAFPGSPTSESGVGLTLQEPILDPTTGKEIGKVVAAVTSDAILPYDVLETRFGSSGYSAVLDRASARILYHPRHALWRRNLGELTGPTGWNLDPDLLDQREGTFTYREADSLRVAFFQSLGSPPWTVLASGSVEEFGAPFLRARGGNLALILFLALAVAGAYALLTRRATRSLVALTQAADRVGEGNLNPELPEAGGDEVGRLAGAFRVMVERVGESLRQMEASRQMAAVGQFASQISHEIRNPLTSMKLNLQGLKRDAEGGRIPAESARPVELCLKEVQRLDRVVGGVLSLARPPSGAREPCSVHGVIGHVLDVLGEQFTQRKVGVEASLRAKGDTVLGEPEALEALVLNLCLNAVEAMAGGGELRISTEPTESAGGRQGIRVRIADDGPGIPPQLRDEIFHPFFSTKKDGTGLGLSLAARIAENHGGDLKLVESPGAARGAEFAVELPLATDETGS